MTIAIERRRGAADEQGQCSTVCILSYCMILYHSILMNVSLSLYIYIYVFIVIRISIVICICMCVCIYIYIYIYRQGAADEQGQIAEEQTDKLNTHKHTSAI